MVVHTKVDGMPWQWCSVISSGKCEEPSRLLLDGFDDGACEEHFVAGTMLDKSASEGAEVNLMISFRADNGARERSPGRLCVTSFLAARFTTGAFLFLLLRRLASRLESRLVLGSGDEFLRAFFES